MNQDLPKMQFGNYEFEYSIIKTDRKSIGIMVEPDGQVIIKSPKEMDETEIDKLVFKKRKWITEKLKRISEFKYPIPSQREFISGEKIKIKSKLYRLKIHLYLKKRAKIVFAGGIIHIYINENLDSAEKEAEIKNILIKWYKTYAYNFISNRIIGFTKFLNIQPSKILIRDLRLRWGSWTKSKVLIFNWKIIMAPISIIDYVILHEVCHLIENFHSPKFWDLLTSIMPDYEERKEWLRIYGPTLKL